MMNSFELLIQRNSDLCPLTCICRSAKDNHTCREPFSFCMYAGLIPSIHIYGMTKFETFYCCGRQNHHGRAYDPVAIRETE